MPPEHSRSPARLLAPLALVITTVAVFAILLSGGGSDDESPSPPARTQTTQAATTRAGQRARRSGVYTVRTGDTLAGIADKVGLTVEKLQELNPELDPQSLISGQKIKLRE